MQQPTPTILVIDDREDIRQSLQLILEDEGYQVKTVEHPLAAQTLVRHAKVDLMLLDMNFALDTTSGQEGLAFLNWCQQEQISVPVVAMTAWSNTELIVKVMQLGAKDFVEKPWNNKRLLQIVKQQLALSDLSHQNQKLAQQLQPTPLSQYQWQSSVMQQLLTQLDTVAATDANILLTGENGTGKSEFARYLHQRSSRRDAPLVQVNMGAISENLFESEMFGHVKGAFTDAKQARIGRFELAEKGTLFLDEIANIPLSQQAKLLRVLESGEYEVLGSSVTQQANVRIISATNSNFSELIANQQFREDLYYRLNTMEFRLPTLAERAADIVPLAEYFLAEFSHKYHRDSQQLSPSANAALLQYSWPGNIRELRHVMERAVLLCTGQQIGSDLLHLGNAAKSNGLPMMTLEQAERQLIKMAMQQSANQVAKAAHLLGITKSSLYRRLEKYELASGE